ncbi:hypothetical protein J6590_089523 [Homalodisca vitripennis]|nr:hypothetical protein J6590_089523 [Homalodisca vitripennis]
MVLASWDLGSRWPKSPTTFAHSESRAIDSLDLVSVERLSNVKNSLVNKQPSLSKYSDSSTIVNQWKPEIAALTL